jgi:hypothetical protein
MEGRVHPEESDHCWTGEAYEGVREHGQGATCLRAYASKRFSAKPLRRRQDTPPAGQSSGAGTAAFFNTPPRDTQRDERKRRALGEQRMPARGFEKSY